MQTPLPPLAWPLGLAGLLPFLAGLIAVSLGQGDFQAWAARALAAYGAVILSFLGAVHWGLALAAPDAAARARLIGGVAPSLLAWLALLLPPQASLALLAAGLLCLTGAEIVAARQGLLPWAYLRLRMVLSAVAAACLLGSMWQA